MRCSKETRRVVGGGREKGNTKDRHQVAGGKSGGGGKSERDVGEVDEQKKVTTRISRGMAEREEEKKKNRQGAKPNTEMN